MNVSLPQRKPLRLPEYDYGSIGGYFLTICIHNRICRLSRIEEEKLVLTQEGQVVESAWLDIPKFNKGVNIDQFMIMPNHVHGILLIEENDDREGQRPSPTNNVKIPEVIRRFKSFTANQINKLNNVRGEAVWQRSYYDRIIRGDKSLYAIREYIVNNPFQWHLDSENPEKIVAHE